MGMFDEITCNYPLPDPEAQELLFQTKDLRNFLERYTITETGRLIYHETAPVWQDESESQTAGLVRIPLGDVDLEYHGDVYFYTGEFEYRARFTNGCIEWIKRYP